MNRRAVGAAVLVAVAATVWIARFDHSAMPEIGRFRDDAYYYFAWVRNLLSGNGPTVSAGVATNGLHVGWAMALVPLWAFGGDAGLVGGARWLGLACLGGAALVLFLVLRREGVTSRWAAVGAFAVLADARLVDEAQNGQETAMACLAVALLLGARRARTRWFVLASVLAVAARSDLILVVAALSVVRPGPWPRRASVTAITLGCYATWNVLIAGHPLQDSAAPMPWLAHTNLAPDDAKGWLHALWWWGRPCLLGAPFATMGAAGIAALLALAIPLRGAWRSAPVLIVGVAAAFGAHDLLVPAIAAALMTVAPSPDPSARRVARALLVAAVALVALHWLVRWYPRDYYVAPFAIAGAWGLARYGMTASWNGRWILALALVATLATRITTPLPDRAWQESMVLAGQFADRFVPAEAPIGSFNSGIVSWLRRGPVLNLDGVVDRPAFAALREHRLGAFLDRQGVAWLCDNEVEFSLARGVLHACGRCFGPDFDPKADLVEVARFVGTGADTGRAGTGSFRLYRRGGAPPDMAAAFDDLGPRPGGGRWLAWRGSYGEELRRREAGNDVPLAAAVQGVTLVLSAPPARGDQAALYVRSPLPSPTSSYPTGAAHPIMTYTN